MGNAMAHRVLRAGYPLKVHTRTKSKAQSLIDSGAVWADTPSDAANGTAVCHPGVKVTSVRSAETAETTCHVAPMAS